MTVLCLQVYLFVCQLLLGLKLCPTSVQAMRRELFPDEVLDEAIGKVKLLGMKPSTAPEMSDLSLLPPLSGGGSSSSSSLTLLLSPDTDDPHGSRVQLRKSASEASCIGRQAQTDNTIDKILEDHGVRTPGSRSPQVNVIVAG
jgi:hypothetical protein